MVLGSSAGGDPMVKLVDTFTGDGENAIGTTYTYAGGGTGYHLYEMQYDALNDAVDLFIDGVERVSDYQGNTVYVPSARLDFGALGQEGTGDGRYNSVEVALAPEPSGVALLGVGGLLAWRRKRARE
jgi:hypothetical protein